MLKLPVHRIIPFSNVEGIGNRTSIFVQGCNVNCLYCHNSETIPKLSDAATYFTVDELVDEIKKNIPFIRGITVSGGEPTLYHVFLKELFERVHQLGLTCYIDSNGFFNQEKIQPLIQVTDKFLFDVKGIGHDLEKLCFSDTFIDGPGNGRIEGGRFAAGSEHIHNLKYLLSLDKVEEIRLVYIKGFYDEEEVMTAIADVMKNEHHVPLKLIRVHAKGLTGERARMLKGHIPTKLDMENLQDLALSKGIHQITNIL